MYVSGTNCIAPDGDGKKIMTFVNGADILTGTRVSLVLKDSPTTFRQSKT